MEMAVEVFLDRVCFVCTLLTNSCDADLFTAEIETWPAARIRHSCLASGSDVR